MEMLQITHSFDKFVHSFKEEIAFFLWFHKNLVRCLLSLQRMGLKAWITGEDIDIDPSMLDPIFVCICICICIFIWKHRYFGESDIIFQKEYDELRGGEVKAT